MTIYRCPVCQTELTADGRRYVCENQHSYDMAKEGYVNLLLANQKKSADPGDNKAMIASRRQFFEGGYYQPLSDAINEVMQANLPAHSSVTVLDVGCGEGYYLRRLRAVIGDEMGVYYGSDISKWAVRLAAKRDKHAHFSVASLYHLPIEDATVDAVLRIFAPKSFQEFSRVLRDDGIVISVIPAEQHLIEIRQMIYDEAHPHDVALDEDYQPHFELRDEVRVTFSSMIESNTQINHLVQMTPYYWTMTEPVQARFAALASLSVTVDCLVRVYRKL